MLKQKNEKLGMKRKVYGVNTNPKKLLCDETPTEIHTTMDQRQRNSCEGDREMHDLESGVAQTPNQRKRNNFVPF